jgi:hypothetical protein
MFTIITIAFVAAYFILIWFRTDAVAEYFNLLKIPVLFRLKEYNKLNLEGYGGNYSSFLHEYYKDMFLVRLVSCPVCLSFWCGAFSALWFGSFLHFIVGPLTLFFYAIFNKVL